MDTPKEASYGSESAPSFGLNSSVPAGLLMTFEPEQSAWSTQFFGGPASMNFSVGPIDTIAPDISMFMFGK